MNKKLPVIQAKISPGNTKTGRIPAVSLAPCVTCPDDAPCRSNCYAMKAYRMYPQTKAAWNHNTKACNKTPYQYFESIQNYLLKKKPKFFRWHVSGDSPDERYFEHLRYVALMTPDTEHLIFTKRYKFNYRNLPSNLHVVFSMWNKYGNTRKKMPRAWMRDPKNPDPRIPNDAIECPGNCESCGMCWSLDKIGKDVVFNKH